MARFGQVLTPRRGIRRRLWPRDGFRRRDAMAFVEEKNGRGYRAA
jgi:hypothetical protein